MHIYILNVENNDSVDIIIKEYKYYILDSNEIFAVFGDIKYQENLKNRISSEYISSSYMYRNFSLMYLFNLNKTFDNISAFDDDTIPFASSIKYLISSFISLDYDDDNNKQKNIII